MPASTPTTIRCTATLHRPAGQRVTWTFLRLPKSASNKLPSRSQTTVKGTLNDTPILVTLEPDGEGGHWLKVSRKLREQAEAQAGEKVRLAFAPVPPEEEPEPRVPVELRAALKSASTKARAAWSDITPLARRDWIHWITSAKKEETRARRIVTACDMLDKGKRRPCCFDRSGMYSKSLTCPTPEK